MSNGGGFDIGASSPEPLAHLLDRVKKNQPLVIATKNNHMPTLVSSSSLMLVRARNHLPDVKINCSQPTALASNRNRMSSVTADCRQISSHVVDGRQLPPLAADGRHLTLYAVEGCRTLPTQSPEERPPLPLLSAECEDPATLINCHPAAEGVVGESELVRPVESNR